MIKKILKFICFGIAWGCTCFVVFCVIADIVGWHEALQNIFNRLTLHALGTVAIGMGFGTTPIVYTFERLRFWKQVLIHFVVGMGILIPVGFSLGWFPTYSAEMIISSLIIAVAMFFVIWSFFYFYNKAETKKINERLKEIEREREI